MTVKIRITDRGHDSLGAIENAICEDCEIKNARIAALEAELAAEAEAHAEYQRIAQEIHLRELGIWNEQTDRVAKLEAALREVIADLTDIEPEHWAEESAVGKAYKLLTQAETKGEQQ